MGRNNSYRVETSQIQRRAMEQINSIGWKLGFNECAFFVLGKSERCRVGVNGGVEGEGWTAAGYLSY